jgi:hypothetical protein
MMLSPLGLVLLGVLGGTNDAQVKPEIPAWAGASECRIVTKGSVSWTGPASGLLLSCTGTPVQIQCDGVGIEPLDSSSEAVCDTRRLLFIQGETATVRFLGSGVTVEWLEQQLNWELVKVAERPLDRASPIYVAESVHRFLRFRRVGAVPVTVPAWVILRGNFILPAAQPGSELIVRRGSGVLPTKLRFSSGAFQVERELDDDGFELRGIPRGPLRIQGVYAGGLTSPRVTLLIGDSESKTYVVVGATVGGVALGSQDRECQGLQRLAISKIEGSRVTLRHTVRAPNSSRDCEWRVDGLEPGQYRVSLHGPKGSLGRAEVSVKPHEVSKAVIPKPQVLVVGRVPASLGAEVRVDAIRIGGADSPSDTAEASPHDGSYRLYLRSPGRYALQLRDSEGRPVGHRREAVLKAGQNAIDWEVPSGVISVSVSGAAFGASIQISVEGPLSQRWVLPPRQTVLTRTGLPLGTYTITAVELRDGDRLVSAQPSSVTLTTAAPLGSARIQLARNKSTVSIAGPDGTAVRRAVVTARAQRVSAIGLGLKPVRPIREVRPGVFDVSGVPPGAPIYISTPDGSLSPSCVLLGLNQTQDVVLQMGTALRADLVIPPVGRVPPMLVGAVGQLPGSTCPVPWSSFKVRPTRSSHGVLSFVVDNFPKLSQFEWHVPGTAGTTKVPVAVSQGTARLALPIRPAR